MSILFCWHKSDTTKRGQAGDLGRASCEEVCGGLRKNQARIRAAFYEQV